MNELQTITKGLPEPKAKAITDTLSMFFDKAGEWQSKVESLVITKPDQIGEMKMAREGRLHLKTMRLQADKTIKEIRTTIKNRMADDLAEDKLWLKAGQMIEITFKKLESDLEHKEKFAERYLQELQEKQRVERLEIIKPYDNGTMDLDSFSFGTMTDEQFESTLSLFKRNFETAQEEAEKKRKEEEIREKQRIADEERIRKENEALKAKAEAERAKARAAEEEIKRINRENEAKMQEERRKKEKAEAELKAEREANRIKNEREEKEARFMAEQQARMEQAPDKDKLLNWVNSMTIPPLSVKDEKAIKAYSDIASKFRGFKNWATQEINKL